MRPESLNMRHDGGGCQPADIAPCQDGLESVAGMMRPSSVKRVANIRSLLAELSRRDIGRIGVAALLQCSLSAARIYLMELCDARVVSLRPVRPGESHGNHSVYRLTNNEPDVREFLALLEGAPGATRQVRDPEPRQMRRTWRPAGCVPVAGEGPARRDPLVAALFGAAPHS
jgi:hypothetical protein